MRALLTLALAVSIFASLTRTASAFSPSDRTWLAAPPTNNWNDGNNWQPNSPPNTLFRGAVFAQSKVLNPTFNTFTVVGSGTSGFSLYFRPEASAYKIEINGQTVT